MNREEKLFNLRKKMLASGISAVIIPSTDPHSSEYVHGHWKTRSWFSGFDGSAGTLVVTNKESGLWTDFRYYIQAEENLKGSEIKLYKDGFKGVKTITEFIKDNLLKCDIVGLDGSLFSTTDFENYKKEFNKSGIDINRSFDPLNGLWNTRPAKPSSKAFDLDIKYTGESREDKIDRVKSIMKDKGVDTYIISSLSDIAWLLNIRGADVDYTPLILSYVIVKDKNTILFIDDKKLPNNLREKLVKAGIVIKDYTDIADSIIKTQEGSTVFYMPESLNCYLSGLIPHNVNVVRGLNITTGLKAIKNSTEIKNTRIAMEKDGAALVKFYREFEKRSVTETFTEFSLATILRDARLSMDGCVDESFGPIIGYKSNGALCHYSAEEESSKNLDSNGLLLIDSGGQYYQGTTDITRTISLGNPTKEEINHYSLVLKGHIKLSMAMFPEGTTGAQLDILAREPLWENGLNFGHGTGHGVGYFLGVHEGPQNISPKSYKTPLEPGMITSNEPGLYIEGSHGIRIENLVLTKFIKDGLYQKFYGFETLTLYPYDLNLIDLKLLNQKEIDWLNNYHKEVRERIAKYLSKEEIQWLEYKTREV